MNSALKNIIFWAVMAVTALLIWDVVMWSTGGRVRDGSLGQVILILFLTLGMVYFHYRVWRLKKIRLHQLILRHPDEFAAALRQIHEDSQRHGWIYRKLVYIAKPEQSVEKHVEMIAARMDAIDHYTRLHSQSVSRLAQQIARQMGLSDSQVEEVRLGGLLHGISKLGVPGTVLNKPPALTPEEYGLTKSHPVLGAKILEPLKAKANERIRGIVRSHHERWDGTGYPDGLKGEQIPLGARIVAVAEAFDTMCSKTAYKGERSFDEAVAELRRCSGTQFDPDIVDALFRSLGLPGESHAPHGPHKPIIP